MLLFHAGILSNNNKQDSCFLYVLLAEYVVLNIALACPVTVVYTQLTSLQQTSLTTSTVLCYQECIVNAETNECSCLLQICFNRSQKQSMCLEAAFSRGSAQDEASATCACLVLASLSALLATSFLIQNVPCLQLFNTSSAAMIRVDRTQVGLKIWSLNQTALLLSRETISCQGQLKV